MLEVARTPAALFRQMRSQDRPLAELEFVRKAYDFGVSLSSGRFEVDGGPFQVHNLGTASILTQLGAPAHVIGMSTFHNAYRSGDWRDGRRPGAFPRRRALVRDAFGPEAEAFLFSVFAGRAAEHTLEDDLDRADHVDADERWRMLLGLADLLDKWDDGRVMYSAAGRGDREFVEGREAEIVALAARLGTAELAESLEAAFARVAAEEIPESLKLGRVNSVFVQPLSSRERPSITIIRFARQTLGPLRKRLRRNT